MPVPPFLLREDPSSQDALVFKYMKRTPEGLIPLGREGNVMAHPLDAKSPEYSLLESKRTIPYSFVDSKGNQKGWKGKAGDEGRAIMNPAVKDLARQVVMNDARQRGLLVQGRFQPGLSILSGNDWYHVHPFMTGTVRKGEGRNGLGYLSDYEGMYGSRPRSLAQKEMVRLLLESPDIRKILKGKNVLVGGGKDEGANEELERILDEGPAATTWPAIMRVLSEIGYGPEAAFGDGPGSFPDAVATYSLEDAGGKEGLVSDFARHFQEEDDPRRAADDFVTAAMVDALWGEARRLWRMPKEKRKPVELVLLSSRLGDIWNASDMLSGKEAAVPKNMGQFVSKAARLEGKGGIPLWRVLGLDPETGRPSEEGRRKSPVIGFFSDMRRGMSGDEAFEENFGFSPARVPSDEDVKDFVSGAARGIEGLLKQSRITDALLRRY